MPPNVFRISGIVNINWDKLHNTSQSVLSTISNVVATMTGQIDGGSNSADILLTIAAFCIWTKLPIQMRENH